MISRTRPHLSAYSSQSSGAPKVTEQRDGAGQAEDCSKESVVKRLIASLFDGSLEDSVRHDPAAPGRVRAAVSLPARYDSALLPWFTAARPLLRELIRRSLIAASSERIATCAKPTTELHANVAGRATRLYYGIEPALRAGDLGQLLRHQPARRISRHFSSSSASGSLAPWSGANIAQSAKPHPMMLTAADERLGFDRAAAPLRSGDRRADLQARA